MLWAAAPEMPAVRLASVDVPLAPPPSPTDTCGPLCGLFGPGLSAPTPAPLAAALTSIGSAGAADPPSGPIASLIGIFIGNGTNAPANCTGAACNGGNAGLLIGTGGAGANGGNGGNGGLLFGNGGTGGAGVAGVNNGAGGNGGNGGLVFGDGGAGGTGAAATATTAAGTGGNGGNAAMLFGTGGAGGAGGAGLTGTPSVNPSGNGTQAGNGQNLVTITADIPGDLTLMPAATAARAAPGRAAVPAAAAAA
jgi:hypothetical protein